MRKDEILNLIESVSEGFPFYSYLIFTKINITSRNTKLPKMSFLGQACRKLEK